MGFRANKLNVAVGLIGIAGAFVGSAHAAPSLESFAAPEEVKDAVISPDGRYLAILTTRDQQRVAIVRDLSSEGAFVPVMKPNEKDDFDITWCKFANDTRIVCGMRGTAMLRQYVIASSQLVATDADGKNAKQLMSSRDGKTTGASDRVFDRMAGEPSKIMVQAGSGDSREATRPTYLYSVDFAKEKTLYFKEALEDVRLWNVFTDGAGRLRLGTGYGRRSGSTYYNDSGAATVMDPRPNGAQEIYASSDGKKWNLLEKATAFAKQTPFTHLTADAVSGRAFGLAPSGGRIALWELDLKDGAAPAVAFAHPKADVVETMTDGAGRIIGVRFETDKPQVRYVDEKLAAVVRGIEKAMPNVFVAIRSMTPDAKKLVLEARSDVDPGRFYLYEADSRKLAPLGAVNSKLDSKDLAQTRAIEYPAADGKTVSGYLTALKPEPKGLPLVVLLHDGQGRNHWTYDELTQFLATRGYAVLSVNFRGSTGYGPEWQAAGRNQWGGVVYSDIVDGVKWAIAQGITESHRVCVIGRGYSGYTALLAAIRNADLFACVGSIGGRSDLADASAQSRLYRENAEPLAGDDEDKKAFKDEWPIRNVEKVSAPILMIHGTLDTRAPIIQSEGMAAALAKAGKPHKFVKVDRATQYFWRPAERAAVLRETEAFLSANLPVAK